MYRENSIILAANKLLIETKDEVNIDFFQNFSYYELGRDTTSEIYNMMDEYEERYKNQSNLPFILNLSLFEKLVKNGGELDLKNRAPYKTNSCYVFENEIVDRDALGNITYGYFGKYLGIPDSLLLGGAGFAQIQAGTSSSDFLSTFGDDPRDQYRIWQGIELYERRRGG